MLNTNNNAIKNSNGVNKKFFNLIFISFLFLGLLTLFSIQTAKAFQAGDVVFLSIEAGNGYCSIGNSSANINLGGYYALWEKKIDRSTFAGSPPYCLNIIKKTITGPGTCKVPGCCKILGCGSDLSLECVNIKYLSSREYTGGLYEGIYHRQISEYCKKCHVEVVEVTTISGNRTTVKDTLVAKNRCAKYKAGACDTPCPDSLTCPVIERDCVIENRNGDDDVEDENDYRCVDKVATAAAPAAGAPIARETPAAAPITGGGAVLGVANTTKEWKGDLLCECKEKVAKTPPWTWCPSTNKGGCCPPEKPKCCSNVSNPEYDASSNASICCVAGLECGYSKFKQTFYCDAGEDCPVNFPKKCEGGPPSPDPEITITDVGTCCKEEQLCEFYMTKIGNMRIHYCGSGGDKCDDSTDPGYCAKGVCCTPDETCADSIGIFWCNSKGEKECTDAGGTYCEGHVTPEVNLCCKGETPNCLVNPNGVPSCY